MARDKLQPFVWNRRAFSARVGKLSYDPRGRLFLLLVNLRDGETGEKIADHVWVERTDKLMKVGLRPSERITFEATVRPYLRAVGGIDYELCRLRKVTLQQG